MKEIKVRLDDGNVVIICTCGVGQATPATSGVPKEYHCKCGSKFILKGIRASVYDVKTVMEVAS